MSQSKAFVLEQLVEKVKKEQDQLNNFRVERDDETFIVSSFEILSVKGVDELFLKFTNIRLTEEETVLFLDWVKQRLTSK